MDIKKIIRGLFSTKGADVNEIATNEKSSEIVRWSPRYVEEIVRPFVVESNFLRLFNSVPEVFFPIDYIASRVAGANFVVKRTKDDSIVWRNTWMNKIMNNPNCITPWNEFVYQHHVYKLCTGNSFVRAAMSETFTTGSKYRFCDNFWVLPADKVKINPVPGLIPLFGICNSDDIIKNYNLRLGFNNVDIPTWQIWHDRDLQPEYLSGSIFLKSNSRLLSQIKPISNLIAVYEARNVIYVKRGGLGFIVSAKSDPSGTVALTDKEKEEIRKEYYSKYGVGEGQHPLALSTAPISFVRTNLSIAELQPFEETLADAISIAGCYGIPAVLVPRKDQSTFSNQASAEKSVYSSVVIPLTKQFCKDFTTFLGLDRDGLYLDCDFSNVDCLQAGLKESEQVKTLINNRCEKQFNKGLITLNDWRAQIGESKVENELFDKLKFDMSDDELNMINRVFNTNVGVEQNERENQESTVQDKGE